MNHSLKTSLAAAVLLALTANTDANALDAPDEVLLHIVAQGVARVAPDEIVATEWISEQGDTAEASEAAFRDDINRRREKLRAAGIAVVLTTLREPTTLPNANAAFLPVKPLMPRADAPASGTVSAMLIKPPIATVNSARSFQTSGSVEFTMKDAVSLDSRQLDVLRTTFPGELKTSLIDERRGHESAVADAVAKARADAALYAADMGFHVVRVKSLSNDGGMDLTSILAMVQREGAKSNDPTAVQVSASLRVDFVVAPN